MDQDSKHRPRLEMNHLRLRFDPWRHGDLDEKPIIRSHSRADSKQKAATQARLRIPPDHPDIPF